MLLKAAVSQPQKANRIISLVPSITELLHYLNLNEEVAGITRFCIHPAEWFRNKTKIGGTKNINIKRIQELQPDLIIANKEENEKEQVEELAKDFNVLLTDVKTVDDAYAMIKDIGIMTCRTSEAKKLILDIKKEFTRLQEKSSGRKTAYLIWRNPYMTIGGDTFINDMLQRGGLQNIFAQLLRYPKITADDIMAAGCNLVMLSSEPYPFKEKHITELQQYLPGVPIILVDGEMFSWYGSRMLQMPQYLLSLLNSIESV